MNKIPETLNAEITPTEFEKEVHQHLIEVGNTLRGFEAIHNTKLLASDGEYQIDIQVDFEALNTNFKVLVECKRYKNSINREKVQILHTKLISTGSQKGIIYSTSAFQRGAILYAQKHRIALIRVIEGKYTYVVKSKNSEHFSIPEWANEPKYVGVFEYINEENGFLTTCNLQKGYMESLSNFIFKNS